GQIITDPLVRAEQRQMSFIPTTCDVRKHWKERQFIIVVAKNQRIVTKQDEAESDDNQSGGGCAEDIFSQRTTGFHSVMTRTLSSMPWTRADSRKRSSGSSSGS